MGIKGIYKEIGPGDRIALSKLAVEFFEKTGRPLRLAIDTSIWLFQIQAGEGGTNPALRTFYYRLLRLISLSIHPVFVFDGPNKPPFKRNKRTLGPGVKTASIPEFLAKQLLKHFALPVHLAPGEAEAECALLQRLGYVDAVLSEDADTLMFGSGLTIRNLSPEGSLKTKVATHVNVYDADKVKETAGLDREGMILVALMSGGDYIPEGIPGCGPKTACQAARAGFGHKLCSIERDDAAGLAAWKEYLTHELHTNESKFFGKKCGALQIPTDFPRRDILRFYTHPCVSSERVLQEQLRDTLQWDKDIDIKALRGFAGDAFEWFYISGAKKFIRNLAPALLVKELRLRASAILSDDPSEIEQDEARLVKSIHLRRNHISTDHTAELRIGFIPKDLVPLDLTSETPDPETTDDVDFDDEEPIAIEGNEGPSSPKKKRAPSSYDPTCLEKIWLLESFVKIGVPLKVQDWENSLNKAVKARQTASSKESTGQKSNRQAKQGIPKGALDRFTKVTKPGADQTSTEKSLNDEMDQTFDLTSNSVHSSTLSRNLPTKDMNISSYSTFRIPLPLPTTPTKTKPITTISLLSSPDQQAQRFARRHSQADISNFDDLGQARHGQVKQSNEVASTIQHDSQSTRNIAPSVNTRRRRSPLRRVKTTSGAPSDESLSLDVADHNGSLASFREPPMIPAASSYIRSTFQPSNTAKQRPRPPQSPSTPAKTSRRRVETVNLCSSPSTPRYRQTSIAEWASPQKSPSKTPTVRGNHKNKADAAPSELEHQTNLDKALALSGIQSTPVNTALPLQPRQDGPNRIGGGIGDMIRIRESLDGAWKVQERCSEPGAKQTEQNEEGSAKRKRRTEWRISQVQVLDLTEA